MVEFISPEERARIQERAWKYYLKQNSRRLEIVRASLQLFQVQNASVQRVLGKFNESLGGHFEVHFAFDSEPEGCLRKSWESSKKPTRDAFGQIPEWKLLNSNQSGLVVINAYSKFLRISRSQLNKMGPTFKSDEEQQKLLQALINETGLPVFSSHDEAVFPKGTSLLNRLVCGLSMRAEFR